MAQWVRPTSHVDNGWTSPLNAYDGNTGTVADYGISGGAWSTYLEMYVTGTIFCSSLRVFTNAQNSEITLMQIDIYDGTTWTMVSETTPSTTGAYLTIPLNGLFLTDGIRIRFFRPSGGGTRSAYIGDTELYADDPPVANVLVTTGNANETSLTPIIYTQYPAIISGSIASNISQGNTVQITSGTGTTVSGTVGLSDVNANTPTITGQKSFEIERSIDGSVWEHLTWAEGLTLDDIDSFVVGSEYCYRIRRRHGDRYSEWSNISCVQFATISEPKEVLGSVATTKVNSLSPTIATSQTIDIAASIGNVNNTAYSPNIVTTKFVNITGSLGSSTIQKFAPIINTGYGANVLANISNNKVNGSSPTITSRTNINVSSTTNNSNIQSLASNIQAQKTIDILSTTSTSKTNGLNPTIISRISNEVISTNGELSINGQPPMVLSGTSKNILATLNNSNVDGYEPTVSNTKFVNVISTVANNTSIGLASAVEYSRTKNVIASTGLNKSNGLNPIINTVIDTHVITNPASEVTSSTARLHGTLYVNKGVA